MHARMTQDNTCMPLGQQACSSLARSTNHKSVTHPLNVVQPVAAPHVIAPKLLRLVGPVQKVRQEHTTSGHQAF